MHSIKILETNREEDLKKGTFFIELTVEVSNDGEVLHTRKVGVSEDATEKQILATLEDLRAGYDTQVRGEERIAKHAAKAKKNLVGVEIKPPKKNEHAT